MKIIINQYHHTLLTGLCLLMAVAFIAVTGCSTDSDSDSSNEIVDVKILPDEADIEVGESIDFSVVGLTASGDEVPIPEGLVTQWQSTNSTVFTVESNGTATGQEEGTAFCTFSVSGESQAKKKSDRIMLLFTGRDSAFVRVSLPAGF